MKETSISKTINKSKQSIDFKEILKIDDKKLMISIKSDSYDFQSHARIELWNGEKWHNIFSIHYEEMKTPSTLYHARENQPMNQQPSVVLRNNNSYFMNDRNKLLSTAKEIIF